MANATAITVTTLTPDAAGIAQPTADVLDTGSTAVTLSADVGGLSELVLLEVKNTAGAANDLTVTVLPGDNPPAQRAGQGGLDTVIAQNATKIIGPLESARFIQNDGKLDVTFTPAAGTIGAQIRCYKLPRR
ncbi:MAG TPA: hypothetical protein GYA08_01620 [Chloroflexi bacterium]|nr:hypothetical protein [Chloroflexota bacterium]